MKIAILAPSPVPYAIGGIENLVYGLYETINQKTPHQAEIIKLPSREFKFFDLIHSYKAFYELDLTHFDCVLVLKYPCWMIRHPNVICYMFHCLRGLYDTYHCFNMGEEVKRGNPDVDRILDYMEDNPKPRTMDTFFEMLSILEKNRYHIPAGYFTFPGPFIRKIVHYLDAFGLSQPGVRKFFSTSKTVSARKDYFPPNVTPTVLYPPPVLKSYNYGNYDYLFMASRLDEAKRIDMLVRAMRDVKSDIKLYIAGTGPKEKELKELAAGDSRIEFLGFVNDDELETYYANCLAVPYFPLDEDFGLITIEAMLHKKPVITTYDAGGPTELVVDGKSGYITAFEERAIAQKIDALARDPKLAIKMGQAGWNSVQHINWINCVNSLLGDAAPSNMPTRAKQKITVTSTFPIYPPQGGGQARLYYLFRSLAKASGCTVEFVSLTNTDCPEFRGEIAPNMYEIRIPKSQEHQQLECTIEQSAGIPVSDIVAIQHVELTPQYVQALKESIEQSDLVIVAQPYLYPIAEKIAGERPILFDSMNVEWTLKKGMLPESKEKTRLLTQVFDCEKRACEHSDAIFVCSQEDMLGYHEHYGIPFDKMILVPNGVDARATHFTDIDERLARKQRLGLEGEKVAVFMGSWHQPNIESCEFIFSFAKELKDFHFILLGSQCNYFERQNVNIPENVGMMGLVSDETKNLVLSVCDIALNPMISGSGTNLKMFDYMACGIPIISTPFGTRGIDNKSSFIIADVEEFPAELRKFNLEDCKKQIEDNREYVSSTFDWDVIVQPMKDIVLRVIDKEGED